MIGYACPPKLDAQSFGGQYHDVFCAFDDVRAAAASFHEIHVVDTKVNIKYISHNEYAAARLTGHASGKHSAFCDGQVIFFAHFVGLTTELTTVTTQHLSAEVYALAESFGEVLAFIEIECGGGAWQFRAEYYKISVAKEVAETITKAKPKQSGVSCSTAPPAVICEAAANLVCRNGPSMPKSFQIALTTYAVSSPSTSSKTMQRACPRHRRQVSSLARSTQVLPDVQHGAPVRTVREFQLRRRSSYRRPSPTLHRGVRSILATSRIRFLRLP